MNVFVVHASHRLTDHAAHGDGLIALGFIEALAAQGHKLWVAAPRIDLRGPKLDGVEFFELAPSFENTALRMLEYAVRSRLLYERLSRTVRFDVAHQLNPVVRGYAFGMAFAKTPLVLGPYVGDWPIVAQKTSVAHRARALAVRALRTLADFVTQRQGQSLALATPYALNRLPGISMRSPRVHVVPHGIDEIVFRPRSLRDDATRDPTTILMIGCARHKGVFTMLDAFESIARAVPAAKLVIAGGGPHSADVRAIVDASEYRSRVSLIGSVPREEMPELLRNVDIVAVPSFGEPYGMVVLEAMASGKPVAATDAGGIPHLLGTKRTSFAPGDYQTLAKIVIALLVKPGYAREVGDANRARAVERFTWNVVTRDLIAAYEAAKR